MPYDNLIERKKKNEKIKADKSHSLIRIPEQILLMPLIGEIHTKTRLTAIICIEISHQQPNSICVCICV